MATAQQSATRLAANSELTVEAERLTQAKPGKPLLSHGRSKQAWRIAHDRMKADDGLWLSLSFAGIQHDGVGGLLEHRRCPCCGSTLSRRTTALHAVQVVANLSEVHSRSLDAIVSAGDAAQRVESLEGCPPIRTQSA